MRSAGCKLRALVTVSIGSTQCLPGVEATDWYEYDCQGTIGSQITFDVIGSNYVKICGVEVYGMNSWTIITTGDLTATDLNTLTIKTDNIISATEYYVTGHTASGVIVDYFKLELTVK